jgi:purine-nucleoside phosphorylase
VKSVFLGGTEKAGNHSTDAQGRVNYVTFAEAKQIVEKVDFGMRSINEYWKALVKTYVVDRVIQLG